MEKFDAIIEESIVNTVERSKNEKEAKNVAELMESAAKVYSAYNDDIQGRWKAEHDNNALVLEKTKLEVERDLKLAEIECENKKSKRDVIKQVAGLGATFGMAALCFKQEADGHIIPDRIVKFAQSFARIK